MNDSINSVNNVYLNRHELEALYQWHKDQEYRHSGEGEYLDAEHHKKRAEELWRLIK